MNLFELKIDPRPRGRGFTLVEMLVVIAIMSILMTAGAIGLGGMGGKGVTSGVATAESLFDEARAIAVGQRTRARVLICKDLSDKAAANTANRAAYNLRRIVVASEKLDANGIPIVDNWVLTSRGAVLPDQTFFSAKYSFLDHQTASGTLPEMSLTAAQAKAAYAATYYYYEFNAEGICTSPGASFVVGSGARGLTSAAVTTPPRVTSAGKRDFGGFVVWRNGRTSAFRSPSQISSEISSLNTGAEF